MNVIVYMLVDEAGDANIRCPSINVAVFVFN